MNTVDFAKRFSNAPDEELLSVVSADGFVAEAVDAARAELARRNISPDDFADLSVQVEDLQRAEESRPTVPLSTAGKMAFFAFGPFLLFTLGAAVLLRTSGYRRKSNDAFKWTGIGIAFWFSLSFIMSAIA